jgi:asparagine synthase (glutamine-hydrolysing)
MSVIFGLYRTDNTPVDRDEMRPLAAVTARYGSDGTSFSADGATVMCFQAFHTHARSRLDQQPATDRLGNRLVLDGRLDNHEDIATVLEAVHEGLSDTQLILRAFERWGADCFLRLIGDWSLVLWAEGDQVLYLARDHAGTRTLYFRHQDKTIQWSSYLETFFVDGSMPTIDEEYVARELTIEPTRDLTPYKDIRLVPPGHYVAVQHGRLLIRRHWQSIAKQRISYKSDEEYDEHFLHLFRQAVQRRLVAGSSILAELSGGMDSSSIVCIADTLAQGGAYTPLDTISYFDDSEPDWNERPYFGAVEARRGRVGIHLDCSSRRPTYRPLSLEGRIYPYPAGDDVLYRSAIEFNNCLRRGEHRVILSGIGGDELLGGVPTPILELANHLRAMRLTTLVARAAQWSMNTRQPILQLLYRTAMSTARLYRPRASDADGFPRWLSPSLRAMANWNDVYSERCVERLMAIPSEIANSRAWWAVLESLPSRYPPMEGCYEYRYPYLDRDLVEFLHSIPREQLAQPGRRRLMMRRSLQRIVPPEVLERKRKGYISRGPLAEFRNAKDAIEELFAAPLIAEYGFVDRRTLLEDFRAELTGEAKQFAFLSRAINLELWLRSFNANPIRIRIAV